MASEMSASASAFSKSLRSFQTGGITYGDFLVQVRQLLAMGAAPADLLAIIARRELVEPLPGPARAAVIGLLESAQPPPSATPSMHVSASQDAATVILDEDGTQQPDRGAPVRDAGQDAQVTVGDVLRSHYYLIALVGEGGLSRVYKAIDSRRTERNSPDRYIAVKVLNRPFIDDDAAFSSLQQDVGRLCSLTHPNIVRVFECDRAGSTIFITMEYLVGTSLYTRLRSPLPPANERPGISLDEAHAIIAAVAGALEYAHRHGVIHGDLKPGNVILTDGGAIKVIDFGSANGALHPNTALVTPRYASPQLLARQQPEVTDDVYALACLTYELFTGSHPFDEGSGAEARKSAPPARAGLTPTEYAAVVKGLQFERRSRTPTVARFMQEFAAPPPPPRPRPAWKSPALLFGVAAVVAIAGWLLSHPGRKLEAPTPTVSSTTASPAAGSGAVGDAVPAPQPRPTAAPGTEIRDCQICPLMIVLPPGRFLQGATAADADASSHERPQHPVVIGMPLAMARNTVTVAEFREFATATGRPLLGCEIYDGEWRQQRHASWKYPGFMQTATHPVTCVSWDDAVAYAAWLSKESGHRYRLPSAAEWEYAAAATAGACENANVADQSAARRYPGWEVFACDDGYVNTAPVGSFKANDFGLNDMLGNVLQWTQDCWHDDYSGTPADGSARMDGDCSDHELRGGSWFSSPRHVRASYRNHFAAGYRTSSVGFRLVRELDP